jgi:hypothetical protein
MAAKFSDSTALQYMHLIIHFKDANLKPRTKSDGTNRKRELCHNTPQAICFSWGLGVAVVTHKVGEAKT